MLETTNRPWERLAELIEIGDADSIRDYVELLGPGEAARAIAELTDAHTERLLGELDPAHSAAVVADLPAAQAVALLEQTSRELAAAVLAALPSDVRADLLRAMRSPVRSELIELLPPEDARQAVELGRYDASSAGGLMAKEYLAFRETDRARDVIDDLKLNARRYANYDVQYLYVVSEDGRLTGVLPVRRLLFAAAGASLKSLMTADPLHVPVGAPLDLLDDLFQRHPFLAMPVLDEQKRLLGVVRRSAVQGAITQRSELDHLKHQGIVGGEELRTMPLLTRSRRRLSWLSANILLNILAASVIAVFQDTLSAVIALAVFLPIISDMSGCSGNQAIAVSMRELALGLIKPVDVWRVWLREVSVGLINGIALGILIAAVGWAWKGNAVLGFVVGTALCVNTIVAVSIGGTLPLLLRRMKFDPALASGPLLTTVTDMCGFFLVLGLATLLLPHLTSV